MIESFLSALFFIPYTPLHLPSALAFGTYNPASLAAYASIGTAIGNSVNWIIGIAVITIVHREPWLSGKVAKHYASFQQYSTRYGKWLLVFSGLPFLGGLLTLIAGITRIHALWFMPLMVLGTVGYYYVIIIL